MRGCPWGVSGRTLGESWKRPPASLAFPGPQTLELVQEGRVTDTPVLFWTFPCVHGLLALGSWCAALNLFLDSSRQSTSGQWQGVDLEMGDLCSRPGSAASPAGGD